MPDQPRQKPPRAAKSASSDRKRKSPAETASGARSHTNSGSGAPCTAAQQGGSPETQAAASATPLQRAVVEAQRSMTPAVKDWLRATGQSPLWNSGGERKQKTAAQPAPPGAQQQLRSAPPAQADVLRPSSADEVKNTPSPERRKNTTTAGSPPGPGPARAESGARPRKSARPSAATAGTAPILSSQPSASAQVEPQAPWHGLSLRLATHPRSASTQSASSTEGSHGSGAAVLGSEPVDKLTRKIVDYTHLNELAIKYLADIKMKRREPDPEDRRKTVNQLHRDVAKGISNRNEKIREWEELISGRRHGEGDQVGGVAGDAGDAGTSNLAASAGGLGRPAMRSARK